MEINLDVVPLREERMTSYEIMLSESQERMLLVVKPEHEQATKTIFERWDLHAVVIGKVSVRTGFGFPSRQAEGGCAAETSSSGRSSCLQPRDQRTAVPR